MKRDKPTAVEISDAAHDLERDVDVLLLAIGGLKALIHDGSVVQVKHVDAVEWQGDHVRDHVREIAAAVNECRAPREVA